jgi:hypothetical protein
VSREGRAREVIDHCTLGHDTFSRPNHIYVSSVKVYHYSVLPHRDLTGKRKAVPDGSKEKTRHPYN